MTLLLEQLPPLKVERNTRQLILNCFREERGREVKAGREPRSHMTAIEVAYYADLNVSTANYHLNNLHREGRVEFEWFREHAMPRTRLWRLADEPA